MADRVTSREQRRMSAFVRALAASTSRSWNLDAEQRRQADCRASAGALEALGNARGEFLRLGTVVSHDADGDHSDPVSTVSSAQCRSGSRAFVENATRTAAPTAVSISVASTYSVPRG